MDKAVCSTGFRWLWLAFTVLVLDFISKQWVVSHFVLGQSKPLIPLFNLFYTRNNGAAFSFLSNYDGWTCWFLSGISIAVITVLIVMMYRNNEKKNLKNIAYAFIIGGAIGNLLDRLLDGYVIDFIDFYIGNWHYPTFNLADSFIFVGTAISMLEDFLSPVKKGN